MKDDNAERMDEVNNKIKMILLRHMSGDGIFATGIPDVFMARRENVGITEHRFDRPVVSLLVNGGKKSFIGSREYLLTPNQLLTIGLDMPSSSLLLEASPDNPLLTIFFYINKQMVAELAPGMDCRDSHAPQTAGISVAEADEDILECILRLASLMEKREQIPVRSSMIMRELHYLLLCGPQKNVLMGLYGGGADGQRIFAAIEYLKEHLDAPVRSGELAHAAHMGESTLYRHFKTLTGLSPMQYHKQLRLHEARRLILGENEMASMAAIRVGYESVTQFNREYKRLFGLPPGQSKKQAC